MRFAPVVATVMALACSTLALAQAPQRQSAAEQRAVAAALTRGKLIYDLDQAAWHSTDVMMAGIPKARLDEVRGYVAEPRGETQFVTFYGEAADGQPYAVFVAEMRGAQTISKLLVPADAERALTPIQRRMVQARSAARQTPVQRCADANMNTVVIAPATEGAPVDVYVTTPQVKQNEYPFGGHTRLTVDAAGKVVSQRGFTRSCLTLAVRPGMQGLLFVTHLMDPTPTEIHVWLSYWSGQPVMVAAGEDAMWEVSPAGMKKLGLGR